MNSQNDNFSTRNTFDVNTEKKHKSDLGLSIPEGYFSKSKQAVLEKTVFEKQQKVIPLYRNIYAWSSVAVVALLFTLAIYNPLTSSNELENDILIASLIVEDSDVDQLLEDYMNDELLTDEIFSE
jgi:anti-sigma-K factor RskA